MTRVINLFGAPGTGKSTTAAGLFSLMKLQGYNVELVTEFAKQLVWSERSLELQDQVYITAKQYHKMFILRNSVDVIITDSPLLLGKLYTELHKDLVDNMCTTLFNSFDNMNILLTRVKPYYDVGRLQTEEMSDKLQQDIFELLKDIPHSILPANAQSAENILGVYVEDKYF